MSFGNDTIIFQHLRRKPGTDADEHGQFEMEQVPISAPGCRHRPLTFKEIAELSFDVSTEYWRSTVPLKDYSPELVAAVCAIKGDDAITVGARTFQIVGGVRPHGDMASVPFKMTIISQLTSG